MLIVVVSVHVKPALIEDFKSMQGDPIVLEQDELHAILESAL